MMINETKSVAPKVYITIRRLKTLEPTATAMIGENLKAKKFMTCVETVEKVQILLFIEIHI